MAKGLKKDVAKTTPARGRQSARTTKAKEPAAKPRRASAAKVSKYEQSGAPWWKQHLLG